MQVLGQYMIVVGYLDPVVSGMTLIASGILGNVAVPWITAADYAHQSKESNHQGDILAVKLALTRQ